MTEYIRLSTSLQASGTQAPGAAHLQKVNVCTGTASSVVTIYDGQASTATVVATIDASAKGSYDFGGIRLPNGLFVRMSGANSDVTISYD